MRPSDALTFLIVPVSMLIFQIGDWRKSVSAILVFILLVFTYNLGRDCYSLFYTKKHHINSTSVVGSMTGRMFFFNIYAVGPKIIKKSTIDIKNGPNSKKLISALIDWGRANPLGVHNYSEQGASAYPAIYSGVDTPEEFARALIAEEGLFAHSVMWLALDQQFGAYKADRFFLHAAIESCLSNPKILLLLYDGMVEFFFAGDVVYNNGKKETWNSVPSLSTYVPDNPAFPDKLKRELQKNAGRSAAPTLRLSELLFFWIIAIKVVSVFLGIAFLPMAFAYSRKLACFTAMVITMLVYHAIISVAFAAPHFRYVLPHIPLMIMLATLGIASFKAFVLRHGVSDVDAASRKE